MIALIITFISVIAIGNFVNFVSPDAIDPVFVFAVALKAVGVVNMILVEMHKIELQQASEQTK